MKKSTALLTAYLTVIDLYQSTKRWLKTPTVRTLSVVGIVTAMVAPAYAMTDSLVQQYAMSMKGSANAQNIGRIAGLIDDEAVISINRQGKTSTLDKNAYLQLLQQSWAGATGYRYDITVGDVVVSGDQARVTINTIESWEKGGKTTTFTTTSKATLIMSSNQAVLQRAISTVSVQ